MAGKKSILEFVDHLHEYFYHPSRVEDGYYVTPTESGYSVEMKPEAFEKYEYPTGKFWQGPDGQGIINGLKY